MTHPNILRQIIIGLFLFGCNAKTEVKVEKLQLTPVEKSYDVPIPITPTGLKVSAFLIYEDSTISTFDVLNDKTKALWNTIIGEGDAEKPSTKTKIRLTGQLDGLRVKIINGKKKVVDQRLPDYSGDFEFIIKDTGCEIVKVYVTKKDKTVFKNDIPFHCGE